MLWSIESFKIAHLLTSVTRLYRGPGFWFIEVTCFLSFPLAHVHSFGSNLIFFLLLVKVELFPERHYLKDSTRAFGRLIDFDPITPKEK